MPVLPASLSNAARQIQTTSLSPSGAHCQAHSGWMLSLRRFQALKFSGRASPGMGGSRCKASGLLSGSDAILLVVPYVDFFQKGILKSLTDLEGVRVPLQKSVHFPSPYAMQI